MNRVLDTAIEYHTSDGRRWRSTLVLYTLRLKLHRFDLSPCLFIYLMIGTQATYIALKYIHNCYNVISKYVNAISPR